MRREAAEGKFGSRGSRANNSAEQLLVTVSCDTTDRISRTRLLDTRWPPIWQAVIQCRENKIIQDCDDDIVRMRRTSFVIEDLAVHLNVP